MYGATGRLSACNFIHRHCIVISILNTDNNEIKFLAEKEVRQIGYIPSRQPIERQGYLCLFWHGITVQPIIVYAID